MSSALHPRRLLYCLVAALMVSGIVAGTVPVDASSASGPDFENGIVHEQRGDVASIPIVVAGGDTATVRVVADDGGYSATLAVEDDGDGRATIRLNTFDATYTASDGDAVKVRAESNARPPVAVGDYELSVCADADAECDSSDATGVAQLVVTQRSTDGLRTWVAPASTDLRNRSRIDAAMTSENLTRSGAVTRNDTLVLELRASGLDGALAARNGSNATTRFFRLLERKDVSLTVHDVPGPEQERAYLDLTDPRAATVIPDPRNDSHYLVVDLRKVRVTDHDGDEPANNRGLIGGHHANFTLADDSALTAEGQETVTAKFGVEEAEATLDTPPETDRVFLAPAPNQTVSGRTTLAPGHRVTVEVRRSDGGVRSKAVRVRNGTETAGRFAATFDFGDAPAGTDVTVRVGHDGRSLLNVYPNYDDTVAGRVVALDASVDLTDRLTAQGVLVENAVLSHGGYLAVHRGSADGEVITRSENLAPDEAFGQFVDFGPALTTNATLVVVAHRTGADDALGEPYTENGTVVSESVRFTVETTATTDGETTTPATETETTTDDVTADTSTQAEPGGSSSEIPGFGVSAALIALLAGGLLAFASVAKRR